MALRTVPRAYHESGLTDSFPELRKCLAPEYRHLPTEYLEQIIEQSFGEGVSPEDVESFFSDIGKFASHAAKGVGKALPAVLPVAGTVVGTAFGGPLGGALGGALGSVAGSAVGSAVQGKKVLPSIKKAARPALATAAQTAGGAIKGMIPGAAGGAAAQLLNTLAQPKVLQGLQSLALGQLGNQSIPVAGTQVPVGAIANLIGSLANQAVAEQQTFYAYEAEAIPTYLLNSEGYPIVDPAVPEQRAAALLNLLQQESYQQQLQTSQRPRRQSLPKAQLQEDLDEYYDYLELASLEDFED